MRFRFLVMCCLFFGVQVKAEQEVLIVLNKAEASTWLLDLASGKVVAKLSMGAGPHEVAMSPKGNWALGANYGEMVPGNSLSLIDMSTQKVVKVIDLGEYTRPHGLQWLADGKRAVVTAEAQRKLLVVNVESGEVEHAIDTGQDASHMVVLSPDQKRAYVSNILPGTLTVIDLEKAKKHKVIQTGDGAEGLDVSPDGKEIWVANRSAHTLSIIDSASLEVVATLPCSNFPIRLKMTPDGKNVLVSNAISNDLAIFDRVARKEIKRLRFTGKEDRERDAEFTSVFAKGGVPVGVLIDPNGKRAFIAHTGADAVVVLNLETWQVENYLMTGKQPDGLGFWSSQGS